MQCKELFFTPQKILYENMPFFLFIIWQWLYSTVVYSDYSIINIASLYLAWFKGEQKDFDISWTETLSVSRL